MIVDHPAEGFDPAPALRLLGGNAALLRRLLVLFSQQFSGSADELRAAAASTDRLALGRLAHKLAGASGALAADAITHAARALEHGIRFDAVNGTGDHDGARVAQLCRALDAFLADTRSWLAATDEPPP